MCVCVCIHTQAHKYIFTKHIYESESHSVMSNSLRPHGLHRLWKSPGQNTGVSSLSLLQGLFPTQRLNPGLPHFRQILYPLSHKENPKILVGYQIPSPVDFPNPRIELQSPALQADSLPTELSGKPRVCVCVCVCVCKSKPHTRQ